MRTIAAAAKSLHLPGLILSFALSCASLAAAAQSGDDEDWPDATSRALAVNEGELVFIAPPADRAPLHADTDLRLDANSTASGWVDMRQCYRHLDTAYNTEISYAYREIRNLRVTRADKIGGARIEGQGVALEDVAAGATLCVAAEVRILERLSPTRFRMRHGPYHRRFLDGYYPYHVSLGLDYAAAGLELARIEPAAQPGFAVTQTPAGLEIETWFEGILRISIELATRDR